MLRVGRGRMTVVGKHDAESVAERLRLTLELYEFGEDMMRARLRRLHPSASPSQIEALLDTWLAGRDELSARRTA